MVVVQHSNPKTRDATIQSACPRDLAVEEVNWPKGSYLISFKLEFKLQSTNYGDRKLLLQSSRTVLLSTSAQELLGDQND